MNTEKNAGRYGIQVYLMFESGCLRTIWLPEPPEGKYFLREKESKIQKDAFIEARQGRWYLCEQNAGNNECGFAAERVSRCSVFGHKGPFLNCNPLTIADFVFKPHAKRTFRWSISARKGAVGQGGTGQSKPRRAKQAPICISQPAFVGASAIFDFPRLGRNAHSRNRKMLPR